MRTDNCPAAYRTTLHTETTARRFLDTAGIRSFPHTPDSLRRSVKLPRVEYGTEGELNKEQSRAGTPGGWFAVYRDRDARQTVKGETERPRSPRRPSRSGGGARARDDPAPQCTDPHSDPRRERRQHTTETDRGDPSLDSSRDSTCHRTPIEHRRQHHVMAS